MYHIYIETMSSYVRCLVSTGNHRIEIHTPNVIIHNGGKLKSADVILKMTTILKEMRIAQLSS